ncbi:MAG: FtsK/SpoIIIE N-terminal domain-containing protein, partial [Synergistaceae bacterium]|nr:FtsK/SpoIIIE N-terminal domain-containing protein [Synergistaceae bacterium]
MNYLLVFYTGNEIKRVTLRKGENITVGSGADDTVKIESCGLEASHLSFRHIDGGINIFSRTPFEIAGEKAVNRIISAGDTLKINSHVILTVLENRCDFENVISLMNLQEIRIGRSSKNDIVL